MPGAATVRIDNTTHHVTIPETLTAGEPLARVRTTASVTGGKHDVTGVRYSMIASGATAATFQVDAVTGDVTTNGSLDYETGPVIFHLSIEAVRAADSETSIRVTAYADVIIHIADINDNAPVIVVDYENGRQMASVDENVSPEVLLADVTATDADSDLNGHVSCVLQGEMARSGRQQMFSLRPVKDEDLMTSAGHFRFQVFTVTTFDRELRDRYELTLTCSDSSDIISDRLTSNSVIWVVIGDVNDNRPVVSRRLINLRVVENNSVGRRLTTIDAVDADTGDNAALSYTVTMTSPETAANALSVDPKTGVVTADISFDYEKQRNYEITVRVCDRAVTSLCADDDVIVNVTVVDVNDERPTFEQQEYRFSVVENQPEGTRVGKWVLSILNYRSITVY